MSLIKKNKGNKKSMSSIDLLITVIVGVIVVAIILASYKYLPAISQDILALLKSKQYVHPEISPNNYFSSDYVGIFSNGAVLDLAKGEMPNGCSQQVSGKLSCPQNTNIEFYVGIGNHGSTARDFYARPRIGFDCKSNSDQCANEYWLDGTKPCRVIAGQTQDCETQAEYTFTEKKTYRIYPGAKCLAQDCYDPQSVATTDYYAYNSNSFIEIDIN